MSKLQTGQKGTLNNLPYRFIDFPRVGVLDGPREAAKLPAFMEPLGAILVVAVEMPAC